jgi:hypothetical protein
MTVQILSAVGKGCPDTLVGFRGVNALVEIKDGSKCASKRELNQMQKNWHSTWGGQVCVAETVEDAIRQGLEVARSAGKV